MVLLPEEQRPHILLCSTKIAHMLLKTPVVRTEPHWLQGAVASAQESCLLLQTFLSWLSEPLLRGPRQKPKIFLEHRLSGISFPLQEITFLPSVHYLNRMYGKMGFHVNGNCVQSLGGFLCVCHPPLSMWTFFLH